MSTISFDAPNRPNSMPEPAPTPEPERARQPATARLFDERFGALPPWFVVTQLFFALGWLRAVAAKVISIDWWTGSTIEAFVADHQGATLGWMEPVAQLAAAASPLTALAVLAAQTFVGLSFVRNRHFGLALAVATVLNVGFVAIGAVNPSAFYLIGQGAMALWLIGRRRPTEALSRSLRIAVATGVALGAVSAPFLQTLHPATVIDDPAAMLLTLGGLGALAGELTHRAVFKRGLP